MKRRSLFGAGAILAALASQSAAQSAPAEPASQASVQELNRRVEALERILAPVIGQTEQNSRSQQLLRAQVERLAQETVGELAAMRAELARQATLTLRLQAAEQAAASPTGPGNAAIAAPAAPTAAASSTDYLARARAAIAAQAWGQAEYDASAQLALSAQGEQAAEANYLLGRSLLGQGHVASAAEKFLLVYDSKPQTTLAAENMFYLGEALRQLGLPDTGQLCAVYAETLQQHGPSLGPDRVAQVRTHLSEHNCP